MVDAYQAWICGDCGSDYVTQEEAEDCCKREPKEEED